MKQSLHFTQVKFVFNMVYFGSKILQSCIHRYLKSCSFLSFFACCKRSLLVGERWWLKNTLVAAPLNPISVVKRVRWARAAASNASFLIRCVKRTIIAGGRGGSLLYFPYLTKRRTRWIVSTSVGCRSKLIFPQIDLSTDHKFSFLTRGTPEISTLFLICRIDHNHCHSFIKILYRYDSVVLLVFQKSSSIAIV